MTVNLNLQTVLVSMFSLKNDNYLVYFVFFRDYIKVLEKKVSNITKELWMTAFLHIDVVIS